MVLRRPAHHYVVKLKEGVVEVLADDLRVERIAGAPHDAVLSFEPRGIRTPPERHSGAGKSSAHFARTTHP